MVSGPAPAFHTVKDMAGRLVLGTAQLASDYGIANLSGRPERSEALELLSAAWESGIRRFDTAPAYGSESIIGEFVQAHGLEREIAVLTKIPKISDFAGGEEIVRSVERSLSLLRVPAPEVLFFHHASDARFLTEERDFFENLLHRLPIAHLGISAYEPADFPAATGFELAYQFPSNIFDERFAGAAMAPGRRYARSVFLQGLLSPGVELKKNADRRLVDFHKNYLDRLRQADVDPIAAAISAVLERSWVDFMIIGIEKAEQLAGILSAAVIPRPESVIPEQLRRQAQPLVDPRAW